jgi:hypothetical protein
MLFAFAAFAFWGCSGESPKPAKVEVAPKSGESTGVLNPDEAAIRASLTELFERIKEGDKTVLYENEFGNYRDTTTLSEYMELKKVKDYKYDTLKEIEIDSVEIIGDSAAAYVKIIYKSMAEKDLVRPYKLAVYRDRGKWIKPYQSKWSEEKYYREQKRIYDSVTAGE